MKNEEATQQPQLLEELSNPDAISQTVQPESQVVTQVRLRIACAFPIVW
jgi:hypothetical protein